MLKPKINTFNLKFSEDEKLEDNFNVDYLKNSRNFSKVGISTGIFVFLSFGIMDLYFFKSILEQLYFIRFLCAATLVVLTIYAFKININSNYLNLVSFTCSVAGGVGVANMLILDHPRIVYIYFPGMILVMMYNFCFLKQKFFNSTFASLIIFFYTNAMVYKSNTISTEQITYMNLYLVSSIFIGATIAYMLELSARKEFIYRKELKESLDARREMYKLVVHDLRNPLMVIMAQSNYIDKKKLIDQKHSKRLINNSNKMKFLLDHLLKLCEVNEGIIQVDYERHDIVELTSNCVENSELLAEAKDIKIIHHFSPPIHSQIDLFKTQETIENILSNAIKYSEQNSKIEISHEEDTKFFRITIKDQGQGIKEDEIPKVFDQFSRLSSIPTGGEASNGLGLFLCKNLMEMQGGTITCSSTLKKGSTFSIKISKENFEEAA